MADSLHKSNIVQKLLCPTYCFSSLTFYFTDNKLFTSKLVEIILFYHFIIVNTNDG